MDAKPHEALVASHLPSEAIDYTNTSDRLDWWVPGYYLDLKEKKQKLTAGWHLVDEVAEHDLFVLDELSYRKALAQYPHAFFLLHDVVNERHFLVPIWELACAERARVMRDKRGKFVIDMTQFYEVCLPEVHTKATLLLSETGWKESSCVGRKTIKQVKKL